VLLYAYASGMQSSRQVQRRCTEDLAFRVLSGSQPRPRDIAGPRLSSAGPLRTVDRDFGLVDESGACSARSSFSRW
jgi:hypothetical protein